MKPVRLEILIDDKTLQGIASVKGNLGSMEQFYKQIVDKLKKELVELQAQMKKSMSEGINTDAQAAEIQALTGVVNQLTDELDNLTRAKKKNNSTPIIGDDPAPKMNNIKMSMAQMARELPSLTMGPQMFFLAISNNIPLLQDALSSARKEYDTLTASGKDAIPVWKQVVSAIISPQAALAVGITLLTVYGDEIAKFTKKIISGEKSVNAMAEAEKTLKEARIQGMKDTVKERSELELLYKASQDANRSLKERNIAIDELQKKYPSYFGNLTNEEVLAGKAAGAYDKLRNSIIANAQAKAIQERLSEEMARQLDIQIKLNEQKSIMEKNEAISNKGTKKEVGNDVYAAAKGNALQLTKEAAAYNNASKWVDIYTKKLEERKKVQDELMKLVNVSDLLEVPGGKGGSTVKKTVSNYIEELAEARVKAQKKLEDMVIQSMEEGFQKRQAIAKQQLKEELSRIESDEREQLAMIDKARKAGQSVTPESEKQVVDNANAQRMAANNKYLKNIEQIEKEWQKKNIESWIAYNEKYGTYQQQRVAIIQKYALKLMNTQDENEKAYFQRQQQEELDALDTKFGKSIKQMADLFDDAADKSVKAIQTVIDKYEMLVDYMNGGETTKEELLNLGFTEKDLTDLDNGSIQVGDITNAIRKLKGELKGKSPFRTFMNDLKDGISDIKGADGDVSEIGEGIAKIGAAVTEFLPALSEFSSSIGTIFGFDDTKIQGIIGAVGGLGQTAAGIGQALSGDVVGGVMGAVNGIASVVNSVEGIFGADYDDYNELKDQYDTLNEIWDQLIDKKREYIDISYGIEADKVGQEALDLVEKSIESYRILGRERLNSGASAGSHSIGVRIRKGMSDQGWDEALDALGKSLYDKVSEGRMTGLFDLSVEQLEKLKSEAPTFWAQLDDDVRGYLDNIIEGSERIEEIQEQIKEQLTQTSFENIQDNFWNTLLDMKSDAEAFSEDFTQTLQKAIIKTRLGDLFDDELRSWYEKFAAANEDGSIDMNEYENLQAEYNSIVEKALQERNELMKIFGWESNGESYTQSGRSGTVTTITEETAGRLEGIGNAQLDRIISLDVRTENMSETLSSMANNLATLTENSEYLKRLDDIADNIQNMNSTGVKIKN